MSTAAPAVDASATAGPGTRSPWIGLSVVCLGMTMTFLNITLTVSTLAPAQHGLHASASDLVWIASIFSMGVASLVLTAGALGDIVGRRTVFGIGVLVMGAGSLTVALAGDAAAAITGQAVMGVGGALILPNSLATVTHSFEDPHERTVAVGIWTALSGLGLALGPIVAGALADSVSWQSVFYVNAVVAVVVLVLTPLLVTNSHRPGRRLDPPGVVIATLAIAALNYAVIEGGNDGFGATVVVTAFVVAAVAAVVFVVVELRRRAPMLELTLFRSASFTSANAIGLIVQYAFGGVAIAQTLWFQRIREDTILGSALRLLPLLAVYVVVSAVAARIVRRFGFRLTVGLGLALTAVGLLLMTTQERGTPYGWTVVLITLFGAGAGVVLPPVTAAAIISVPHEDGGMASATVNMFRQVGAAIGASITGTIITTRLASHLPGQLVRHGVPSAQIPTVAHAVASGASSSSAPAALRDPIRAAAGEAFASGLHPAMAVPGFMAVAGFLAALLFLGSRRSHSGEHVATGHDAEPAHRAS